MSESKVQIHQEFGSQIPFAEPYWYQGFATGYYHKGHVEFRNKLRAFLKKEIVPHVDEWVKSGYPKSIHEQIYDAGFSGVIYPKKYGGTMPDDYNMFYELILQDEISNVGQGGIFGQLLINSLALPPIMNYGNEGLKQKILKDVIQGRKCISLAISEPYAGSDVAQIKTSSKKEGDYYIISGVKKWITGGLFADFITTAVRTGADGMGGISLIVIDTKLPGVNIRKMETQFDNAHNTTFITLSNVKVHKDNLIGEENKGFSYIMHNFNHERLLIIIDGIRKSRMCYREAFDYATTRKTFGKPLISHQIIRFKLAEMARQIEANHANMEQLVLQFNHLPDHKLGAQCSLLKVQCTKTFEYCAREASQIFGGSSIVKEGKGKLIEALVRETRGISIYGGSEEIMLDFAMRTSAQKYEKLLRKANL